jgi:hypothetical protein
MIRVPTIIPKSLVSKAVSVTSQGAVELTWFLFVSSGLLLASYYAIVVSGGGAAAVIAGVVLSYLLSDDIKEAVRDLYDRRFYEIKIDP